MWSAAYEAFGRATITTAPAAADSPAIASDLRLAGQREEAETGLHYNTYRDYDPPTGRYIQSDPIGLAGGINTYGYALGDPLSNYDPTGLFVPALPAIAAVTAEAVSGLITTVAAAKMLLLPAPELSPVDLAQKKWEREDYHNTCEQPPPPNLTGCALWLWQLNQAKQCINKRDKFTDKWYNGSYDSGHAKQMDQWSQRIKNLEDKIRRLCKNVCQ